MANLMSQDSSVASLFENVFIHLLFIACQLRHMVVSSAFGYILFNEKFKCNFKPTFRWLETCKQLMEQSSIGGGIVIGLCPSVSNTRQFFAADDFSRRHFQMIFFLAL